MHPYVVKLFFMLLFFWVQKLCLKLKGMELLGTLLFSDDATSSSSSRSSRSKSVLIKYVLVVLVVT